MNDLPNGALRKAAFEPALLRRVLTGQISDETWRQEVVTQLVLQHPASNAQRAVEVWSAPVGFINQAVLDIVRRARSAVKIALVTNATSRLPKDLQALGLSSEFDSIVNSSVVGAAKPEEPIYRAALKSVGVDPAKTLFVDDLSENVQAAQRLGMPALRYEDAASLSQFLKAHQVLG